MGVGRFPPDGPAPGPLRADRGGDMGSGGPSVLPQGRTLNLCRAGLPSPTVPKPATQSPSSPLSHFLDGRQRTSHPDCTSGVPQARPERRHLVPQCCCSPPPGLALGPAGPGPTPSAVPSLCPSHQGSDSPRSRRGCGWGAQPDGPDRGSQSWQQRLLRFCKAPVLGRADPSALTPRVLTALGENAAVPGQMPRGQLKRP